jgi:hypothetical protein
MTCCRTTRGEVLTAEQLPTIPVRAVFFVSPDEKIKAMPTYPDDQRAEL